MRQSRHYKTCTSASSLAIDGLKWESWVLHKVSPLEQLFLDMFVCLCYSSFWEHKHVPCPLLISAFLYPSVVFLSWHYSMTKNQVNAMSIEDMDDAGGRNCYETADMRALWSPTNFIPEDQVRFYLPSLWLPACMEDQRLFAWFSVSSFSEYLETESSTWCRVQE